MAVKINAQMLARTFPVAVESYRSRDELAGRRLKTSVSLLILQKSGMGEIYQMVQSVLDAVMIRVE